MIHSELHFDIIVHGVLYIWQRCKLPVLQVLPNDITTLTDYILRNARQSDIPTGTVLIRANDSVFLQSYHCVKKYGPVQWFPTWGRSPSRRFGLSGRQ